MRREVTLRRYWFWFLQPLVFATLFLLANAALYPSAEDLRAMREGGPTEAKWWDWAALAVIGADVLLFVAFWVSSRRR